MVSETAEAEPRETTSPTGVTVKRKKERGGWKAGAGEEPQGMKTAPAEDLGSTHCRVALLADPSTRPSGWMRREEAPFLQYSRLGSLKWPGGKALLPPSSGRAGSVVMLPAAMAPPRPWRDPEPLEPRGEPPRPGPGLRRSGAQPRTRPPSLPPRGTRPRPRAPSLELFGHFPLRLP